MTTTEAYRVAVLTPIAGDSSVGERLLDDPLFDFIDSQMMKAGTLAHAEVQWQAVEEGIVTLLKSRTKDLKLLVHLLHCLQQHNVTPERFTLSLSLLAGFIETYWTDCYPAPGERGELPRRRFLSQILQRSEIAARRLDGTLFDTDRTSVLNSTLSQLQQITATAGLPGESIDSLAALLRRQLAQGSPAVTPAGDQPVPALSSAVPPISATPQPPSSQVEGLTVDNSSDRATRQTLTRVADFLAETSGGMSLALRLRRFALWFAITAEPENVEQETDLAAPSAERLEAYEEQLQRGADMALLRQVEQSLASAPFWFDAQFLSYRIARALGQESWAEAVQQETRNLFERLPGLWTLCFKGGVPFVSTATRQWLEETPGSVTAASATADVLHHEAQALAEEGGVAVALAMLNEQMQTARQPREQFYIRLLSADLMAKYQLAALAAPLYRGLLSEAGEMGLSDWEPLLIQQLEQRTS